MTPAVAARKLTIIYRIRRWAERTMPIVGWEMRSFMRGTRAPAILFICAALQVVAGLAAAIVMYRSTSPGLEQWPAIGHTLFSAVVLLEAVIMLGLVPVFSAGLMLREYTRRSIDDLLLTHLSGLEIAQGKLLAGLGYFAVVLLCALPVLALTFMFGGVSPWEVFWSQLLLLATAACLGAVGIHCAARYRTPGLTLLMTVIYALGWILLIVPLVIFILLISSMMWVISPLIRQQYHSCFITGLKWLALCICACFTLLLLGFCLQLLVFTYPVSAFLLLIDPGKQAFFNSEFVALFWWLSPLLLSGAMLSSAWFLMKQTGLRIRPTRLDLQ